ncbi:uncharacterized protein ASCRUDRAFT_80369 [Ascoidea rubescens DSM 1968]|uniref:Uncharacterized protein n=1 Tax=Ascoidea rubescens DSM 1968 TaxID=1344418 RepID=A0A1D2VKB9_9ASCO|nr:hypothetical protein ASCRUDRAFT_80369 [Ascoidea rubescens DSM 1968]ODV62048.1 hypothetical protein ASCRUDRAFT_80369 [Ascoidea rubescens DSM 1968]
MEHPPASRGVMQKLLTALLGQRVPIPPLGPNYHPDMQQTLSFLSKNTRAIVSNISTFNSFQQPFAAFPALNLMSQTLLFIFPLRLYNN